MRIHSNATIMSKCKCAKSRVLIQAEMRSEQALRRHFRTPIPKLNLLLVRQTANRLALLCDGRAVDDADALKVLGKDLGGGQLFELVDPVDGERVGAKEL